MINICNISFSCYVTCYCYSIFVCLFFKFENSISIFLKIYILKQFTPELLLEDVNNLTHEKRGSLEIKKQKFHFFYHFMRKNIKTTLNASYLQLNYHY